jgi:hypothetical protein
MKRRPDMTDTFNPDSAGHMNHISRRANQLFEILRTLDHLIEHMDDVGHLMAARDLISSRADEEYHAIRSWQDKVDKAMQGGG